MTDAALLELIQGDETATELAAAGNDSGCAARVRELIGTGTAITLAGLLGMLSTESRAKLAVNPNLTDIRDKALAGDVPGLLLWSDLLSAAEIITSEETATLQTTLASATAPEVVTVAQVSQALLPTRPDGKVLIEE